MWDRLVLAATTPGGEHAVERDRSVRLALSQPNPTDRQRAMVDLFYTPQWGQVGATSHLFGDATMTAKARRRHLVVSRDHNAWGLLPLIRCDTLILHGTDDQMAPVANAELLARRISVARVHLVQSGRHGFFDEFAHHVTRQVRTFLDADDRPAADDTAEA